jgi:hypothetical protein
MKNKFSIIIGVLTLALVVGLNVRHALNDYGVKTDKLHVEVLAQSSSSDGTITGGSGGVDCWKSITTAMASKVLFCGSCTYVDNSTYSTFSSSGKCNP